jgi:oligopeptidase B
VRTVHGEQLVDDYAWMADRDDPRLLAYLEAENAYATERTAYLDPLVEAIVEEIRARTKETDLTVPVRHTGWWYYSRTVQGQEYAVHARLPVALSPGRPDLPDGAPPAGEQVLLDENVEAGQDFLGVGACDVSPDDRLLAWSVDRTGDERYDLAIRDLALGMEIDTSVRDVGEGVAWSLDSRHIFYTRLDDAYRSHEVWRHEVGTPAGDDTLVLAEPDQRFSLGVAASKDDRWVLIGSSSKVTSQVWLIDAAHPHQAPRSVAPREPGVLYDVEPCRDGLLLWHNATRENFEVAWAPGTAASRGDWVPLDVTAADELVTGLEVFEGFVVVSLRRDGLTGLRVVPRTGTGPTGFGRPHDLAFPGPLRTVALGSTPDPASPTVQVVHESLTCPQAVYDYDVASRTLTLLKQREVPGYDPARFVERREWATAPDGVRVPLSIVHRAGLEPDGTAPGLLYGYGAYGIPMDPWFSAARLCLLERGCIYAIAHVRGGTELGWGWYEQGRLTAKVASFTDFLACAAHLVESGWVAADRLAAEGGSAGGLLVGAATNLDPGRFRVVHAQVPFVDPLTTMQDPDLPLTITEQEEWGDPVGDPAAYRLLRSYAPYDNIRAADYPAMLVTASVNDSRVFVTEPATYVARLRDRVTDDESRRPVLLRTELGAGHGGRSGRYQVWRDVAWEYAVLLDLLGAVAAPETVASGQSAAGDELEGEHGGDRLHEQQGNEDDQLHGGGL